MKPTRAILSLLLALSVQSPAAPANGPASTPAEIAELVEKLADEQFTVREQATHQLWIAGEPALAALRKAADGEDPEASHRARELIRKIELHLTPDTDPTIIALVERYTKANRNDKPGILGEMRGRRAWRQMLKLYAAETDPDLRANLKRVVDGVAIHAARERLLAGDATGAREFLEMAPAEPQSLISLAALHRTQGTLQDELERARTSTAKGAAAWRLALLRAAGDLEGARNAALEADEPRMAAAMSLLAGDPLPWLRTSTPGQRSEETHAIYVNLATRQWLGRNLRAGDLDALTAMLASRNESTRTLGMSTLFLLGHPEAALEAYAKHSPLAAFRHYEARELIDDAFHCIGLNPDQPDFTNWFSERFAKILESPGDSETAQSELITLGSFLERSGQHDILRENFDKPLLELSEEDNNIFTNFLSNLYGTTTPGSGVLGPAKRISVIWAGEDALRWEEVLIAAFGEDEDTLNLWNWLAELDPESTREQRLDAILVLRGYGADPGLLRDKWLKLAWADVAKAKNKAPLLKLIGFIASSSTDVATQLKVWDQLPPHERNEGYDGTHIIRLSVAGRWNEAAAVFLRQISASTDAGNPVRPDMHAFAAACLRRAGRANEAVAHDSWAEKLALGDPSSAISIGQSYAFGGDYKRAGLWWKRALIESQPDSRDFSTALRLHYQLLLDEGAWKEAASTAEAIALSYANNDYDVESPPALLTLRLASDLPRALSLLPTDRPRAIAMLEKCHKQFAGEGTLADNFYPALRQAGLIEEHDAWFELSWKQITGAVSRHPASDNTRNTAAWLASRAMRRLDEAETLLKKALELNPRQPAYLDTMAEVHFARGDRKAAIKWSKLSMNFKPEDDMIRRQYYRFLDGPLPR